MFGRRKQHEPENHVEPTGDVEIIFADGKMITIPSNVYDLVDDAMAKAVGAYLFEQERRWFEPRDNQTEYTQGFYAGRIYERRRITDLIKEGNNEGQ